MVKYFLSDLKFALSNIFFNSEHNRPGSYDTLTYSFGESYDGGHHNDGSLLPAYNESRGGWLRIINSYDEVIDDAARLTHYDAIYSKIMIYEGSEGNEGDTTLIPLNKECTAILSKYLSKSCPKVRRHNMFSCVPQTRILPNEGEVEKMAAFLEKNLTSQYFQKVKWVLEAGKHTDNPNLHFHIFGLFNENGSKNFRKRILVDRWNSVYPSNTLNWKRRKSVGIHNKACCTQQLIDETLLYLSNESKGSHENFVDLEKTGGFGF